MASIKSSDENMIWHRSYRESGERKGKKIRIKRRRNIGWGAEIMNEDNEKGENGGKKLPEKPVVMRRGSRSGKRKK